MDAFARRKLEGFAGHLHTLRDQAGEVHLNPTHGLVIAGVMGKLAQVKRAGQFMINPRQQVEVEGCGDARRIVVSGFQHRFGLFAVNSDQQAAAFAHQLREVEQEMLRVW